MDQRQFAKHLRQNLTDAERLLWMYLRAQRFGGHKFRRQHPLGPYVLDFVCVGARLVVEADGGQHVASARDVERDEWLHKQGFRLLRFWNHEILNDTEAVLTSVLQALENPLPNPSPRTGEGL
jgi:very-short-patch-repair endonuclease